MELINGLAIAMAMTDHQSISGELFYRLRIFMEGKPGKLFHTPFAVRLFPQSDECDKTVVGPDIVVICDVSKITREGCDGAPDFVIEILSPSTARLDRLVKFRKYEEAGVKEYWIVDPETRTVQVCLLNEEGKYTLSMFDETDTVAVTALPGCSIDFKQVFPKQSQ
jgi:Uma2 family endonuclease